MSKPVVAVALLSFFLPALALQAAEISLMEPLDYQVVQRATRTAGELAIRGKLNAKVMDGVKIETRIINGNHIGHWQELAVQFEKRIFTGKLETAAGGWYRLEVRAKREGEVFGEAVVEHVGVGEVFVVAGQSNSANHGEEKQTPQSQRVAAFDGTRWQIANDPQPGASGKGGSFMPALGDKIVTWFDVPVGFVACGIGATSVREWLPAGTTFPNPPTIESRVEKLSTGEWASKGEAFAMFVSRMKQLGPHGFRAVLWHQGESDANQKDPTRTLSGELYREYLEKLIRASQVEIGWEAPWFVAQVSYHVPGDEASPDIRGAQSSLWNEGIALEGPDSDALKGDLRERNGQGVHFSGKGLREHAAKWAEKVSPWIEAQFAE
jgi:hypothetical protein